MYKMIAAYGGTVTVPHKRNNLKPWIGKLYPGGKGQSPTVGTVERIGVYIVVRLAPAAYAGHHHYIASFQFKFCKGTKYRAQYVSVAAAAAPKYRQFILQQVVCITLYRHFATSSILPSISIGVIDRLSTLLTPTIGMSLFTALWTSLITWPRFISGTITAFAFRQALITLSSAKGHSVTSSSTPAL